MRAAEARWEISRMTTHEARVAELAQRWEELQEQGSDVTPQELCATAPELLDELILRIDELRTKTHDRAAPKGEAARSQKQESVDATQLPTGPRPYIPPPGPRPYIPPPEPAQPTDFEILGELGHGGMGVVYRAFDRKRREVVALKTIKWLDPSALDLFKREFRSAADLTHPNLIALHELVWDGRIWFFTMDLVEGVDFLSYVRSGPTGLPESTHQAGGSRETPAGPPEESSDDDETRVLVGPDPAQIERLRSALGQLCEGVSALHRGGRLHRDLKPSNVLVKRDGQLVVLDFGLAAELGPTGEHLSTDGLVRGTKAYMSPEQAAGRALTTASDWYTVGVMLYEALTGRRPITRVAALGRPDLLRDAATRPRSVMSGVPGDLDELCVALLEIDPDTRPHGDELLYQLGLRRASRIAPTQPSGLSPLIGRERHLAFLSQCLDELRGGRTAVVRVHGSSGAGKSTLVQRFLEGLAGRDEVVVLSGKCYEHESVPYKALDSLVDALSNYLRHLSRFEVGAILPRDVLSLARVFPAFRRVEEVAAAPGRGFDVPDQQELRRRAFAALRELIARLGDRHRLVLAIDDLQWGDIDSAAVLAELLRGDDAPVILMIACHRDENVGSSPFLSTFLALEAQAGGSVGWHDVAVEPLNAAESTELARALLGPEALMNRALPEVIGRESGGKRS